MLWKYENVAEVQRQYRREFQEDPPTRLTINRIKDKFETNGTFQDVHRQHFGRPRTSTSFTSQERVLESYRETSKNSVSREIVIIKSSVHRILRRCRWKSCIPTIAQAINEGDPD
ncbi:hypothetical protein AVEN_205426-1 [Araneus ventricosus]|uniref:DUF4817 domain-containing protein n=1 Tax=Araneus ventricosus TaxID=182803 RepID=A0A4Y2TYS9_ARAVE|nr:hypothetical protein AVEN_127705-1 [Araneus ventricosus]GBO04583.1 hypothetical protein AVEN_205426-1 [Araneus ventricosus]